MSYINDIIVYGVAVNIIEGQGEENMAKTSLN
jgi:hypothetical protein